MGHFGGGRGIEKLKLGKKVIKRARQSVEKCPKGRTWQLPGNVDHGSRASAWVVLKEQRESRELGRVTLWKTQSFTMHHADPGVHKTHTFLRLRKRCDSGRTASQDLCYK